MTDTHESKHGKFLPLALGALGVVFGDIGTSPLYTMKECIIHARQYTEGLFVREDLFGILSLIFWAMTLVVTVKYLFFIMRADNRGEGGIFALLALVPAKMRDSAAGGRVKALSVLAVTGAALLYGDGVITPAISVLGAVEGLAVANPALESWVVPAVVVILLGLFSIQSRGTGTVGRLFGPVMLLWFGVIGGLGLYHIRHDPEILTALLPTHAFAYFGHHGWRSIALLASVVLAVTGGEALYADMGHFGVKPIRGAWLAVACPALILNYFGQGANILREPMAAENPFFAMVPSGLPTYLLVALSSAAAVIASQALISGAFSLTRQATQLGFLPRIHVKHTAHEVEGQIYIPEVNLALAIGSLALVLIFRTSSNLAAAYGIAVTGTMAITSMMYYIITRETWHWPASRAVPLVTLFLAIDLLFLAANMTKFLDGGYVPVFIAAVLLVVMVVWNRGRTLLAERNRSLFPSPAAALEQVEKRLVARVPGTAVFLASASASLPAILVYYVNRTRALHETVVILSIQFEDDPIVAPAERTEISQMDNGFWRVQLHFGFMEDPVVVPALKRALREHDVPFDQREVVYFLGRDTFLAASGGKMGKWEETLFAFVRRNTAAADGFFGLPHQQVVEIGTQIDL